MSCGVGGRCGWELALLCLWYRLVTTAMIPPLAWEPPYAEGAAQEIAKRQKKKEKRKKKEIILTAGDDPEMMVNHRDISCTKMTKYNSHFRKITLMMV